jgi:chromosome segregation protein
MKLSRIKLTGFKSFVDPVELRIMPGLTGVVGPNGCGKSNLLEAIRWVMGEGSPKSLRGAAMDDVIFAGTASRPQRQFAEVSLLAERDREEIEVVRRIERGAGSAWRINGRDARARDAQLIFADAATGAHSPALVSQGRIGAIIAAKPAERRQMLEEAAGISGLHVRRREAEIRLKATETNLARVDELVVELETRIGVLRRQARSAERYRKLSDDIRVAEGRLIYARWRDAAAAAETARAEAKTADEAVFEASEAQRTAAALSNDATGTLSEARRTAQAARDAAADARHRLSTIETERARVAMRIAELTAQAQTLATDRAREDDLSRDAGEALTRLAAEAARLGQEIEADTAARPGLAIDVSQADELSRAAEVALAKALADAAREAAERRVAEAAMQAAMANAARAATMLARVEAERAGIGDLDALQAARDAALAEAKAAEAAVAEAQKALTDADVARGAAAEARATTESEAAARTAALVSLEAEAKALRRDMVVATGALAAVQAKPGYEAALAAALADDLNAEIGGRGERRWAGAATSETDPMLPAGKPLSRYVEAPPELARRLSQIAVVEADDGAALAVGQRLVTLNGVMRRWDGFVTQGAGAVAAESMKRRNRLAELNAAIAEASQAADAAAAAHGAATGRLRDAATALDSARGARDEAERRLREARRAEDQATAMHDRAATRAVELSERLTDATTEDEAAKADVARAEIALAALPLGTDQKGVAPLETAATAARDTTARLRGDLVAIDARMASAKGRRSAAEAEAADWRARSGKAGKRVEDMDRRAGLLSDEQAAIATLPAQIDSRAAMVGIEAARLADSAQHTADAERAAQQALQKREEEAAKVGEILVLAREARAGAQARAEAQDLRRVEMGRVSGERFECPATLLPDKAGFAADDVGAASDESAKLERATMDRERLGPVNLVAEQELAEMEATRGTSEAERAELTEAVHRLRGSIGSLNREGRQRLRAAFEAVDGHFRELFRTLFSGGEAHLALIDSDDPLEAGLEIMAQPPGKKLTSLTLLSGGEQALTAVALIFALFLTNPAPLCVLDEVDAPLDDANVERFCDLLDRMTRATDTRYLIVTHNAVTMARMHRLYGVTMVEQGVSRLVSVDLGGAEALLAAE